MPPAAETRIAPTPEEAPLLPEGTEVHRARLHNGLTMRWLARGEGPVAILLHGFPELAISWRHQLRILSDRYRIIAPDLRGYGGTDAPSRVRDYRIGVLVDDIVALLDELDVDRAHLVGHDWGGALAWEVAMDHPTRLLSLAICNCPPIGVMTRSFANPKQVARSWYMGFFQVPALADRLIQRDPEGFAARAFRGVAYRKEAFDDASLAPYVAQIRRRGLPGIKWYQAAARFDLLRPARRVDVPTRMIWGVHDQILGRFLSDPDRYGFVESYEVRPVEAGHWVQQEEPEEVSWLLAEHWETATLGSGA